MLVVNYVRLGKRYNDYLGVLLREGRQPFMCLESQPLLTTGTYLLRREKVEGFNREVPVVYREELGQYKIIVPQHAEWDYPPETTIVVGVLFNLHYGKYVLKPMDNNSIFHFFRMESYRVKIFLRVSEHVYEGGEEPSTLRRLETLPWLKAEEGPEAQGQGEKEND